MRKYLDFRNSKNAGKNYFLVLFQAQKTNTG
jgi:hypothetical protein